MILPLFGLDISGGSPSKSQNADAQERLNLYVEARIDNDKTRMALYQTPGNSTFVALGAFAPRGAYAVGDYLYIVQRFSLIRINNAGVTSVVGTLLTESGFVSMVDNGLQLFMVDGATGYCYVFADGEFATIQNGADIVSNGGHDGSADAHGFPAVATTVTFQGSFFVVSSSQGQFYLSKSYDAFTWAALDFATAETNPDALVTVLADHGELVLFGEQTTEFWGNVGQRFPFALIQGSALEWGLAARQAVAKLDNSLIFLGRNRQGRVQVMQLAGHNAVRVSTHELEAKFEDYPTVADATALSYMLDGHPMFQLNFNAGRESWLYDGASSVALGMPIWSRVESAGLGRHRMERVVPYLGRIIGTDYSNGNIYTISHTDTLDGGETITSRLRTRHYFEDNEEVSVGQIWLDIETGVGTPTGQGADPQIMFRYRKNNGTWSSELWRSMGRTGERRKRVYWNRLGCALDWVFEWTITDPVKRAFLNAGLQTLSVKQRRAT